LDPQRGRPDGKRFLARKSYRRIMTPEEILKLFRESQALLEGHFQLTSGLHSPNYFQCAKVLQYPEKAERLCADIAAHVRGKKIDAVIAPALGGIVVG